MSKRFSEQFKQEAVQLVCAARPVSAVAQQLGIGHSTLDKWVRAQRKSAFEIWSAKSAICRRSTTS